MYNCTHYIPSVLTCICMINKDYYISGGGCECIYAYVLVYVYKCICILMHILFKSY